MKRLPVSLLLFAALVSGCAWYEGNVDPMMPSSMSTEAQPAAQQSQARARMSMENAPVSPAAASAIDSLLAGTVHAALRGDAAAIVGNLAPEDRNRIGQFSDADRSEMQRVARQYDSSWNSRYHTAYDWSSAANHSQVFGNHQISQIADRTAMVVLPAESGMQRVTLRLRDVGNNTWRINAPDALRAADIKNRVDSVLTDMNNSRNNWPNDNNQSARMAAYRILEIFSRS